MHCVGIHNARCGGSTRERLMTFTAQCVERLAGGSRVKAWWLWLVLWVRLLLFNHCFWLFRLLFGFEEARFSEEDHTLLPEQQH